MDKSKANAKSIGKKRAKMEPIVDVMPSRASPILADIDDAISLIHGNEKLLNSISLPPLGLGEGGSVAPFGAADFTRALKNGTEYTCTGNLMWLNCKYTSSPGVPVLRSAVLDYAKMLYSDCKDYDRQMHPAPTLPKSPPRPT